MTAVFAMIGRLLARDGIAALVTVVGAKGSTPREAGARMVVSRDGAIAGTIGGGRLELEAIAAAERSMASGRETAELRRFALGPALGQCCGGQVTLAVETIGVGRAEEIGRLAEVEAAGGLATEATLVEGAPLVRRIVPAGSGPATAALGRDGVLRERFGRAPRRVLLFGAGHVGRALVLALAPLPFAVTWIDEREEMFPTAMPGAVRRVATDRPAAVAADAEAGSFALVMTHDHGIDLDILHAVLAHGGYAYAGLIGSATKRARFERRLVELGLPREVATSFRCPIGVSGIRSKEPALIAAGVAADLLIADEAAREGEEAGGADPMVSAGSVSLRAADSAASG